MSKPLWKLMESAFLEGRNPGYNDQPGYAAELCAVADWLEQRQIDAYGKVARNVGEVLVWLRQEAVRADIDR